MSMWLIGILVLNLGQVNIRRRYHILPVLRKIKGNNRSMVVPCMLARVSVLLNASLIISCLSLIFLALCLSPSFMQFNAAHPVPFLSLLSMCLRP